MRTILINNGKPSVDSFLRIHNSDYEVNDGKAETPGS